MINLDGIDESAGVIPGFLVIKAAGGGIELEQANFARQIGVIDQKVDSPWGFLVGMDDETVVKRLETCDVKGD